jgi:hypothetical protein
MKRWVLAAGLLAAAVAPQALAADLDDGEPPPPPSWKAPSWKDGAYGYPPKSIAPPPGYYEDEEDDGRPYSKKYSYDGPPYKKYHDHPYKKYEDDDDDPPAPKKYGMPPHKSSCVRSEQVRDQLTSMGWRDFHAGKALSQGEVTLRARRPSGQLYELRLDRCSGEILYARPLEHSPLQPPYYGYKRPPNWGPYGYGPDAYGPPGYGPYGPYGYSKRPPDWDDDD